MIARFALLIILASSAGAEGAELIKPEFATINLLIEDQDDPIVQGDWMKACRRIGDMLLVHGDPWGYGILSDYQCTLGGEALGGKAKKKSLNGRSLSMLSNLK
jgi:hypothetical protein